MLNSKKAYEKTEKAKQRKTKDTRYVLKYIDKQIKDACNQGKFYIILNNKVERIHIFGDTQYYYIDELPKVTDTLYVKGYNIECFQVYPVDKIKISWEKQEKGI